MIVYRLILVVQLKNKWDLYDASQRALPSWGFMICLVIEKIKIELVVSPFNEVKPNMRISLIEVSLFPLCFTYKSNDKTAQAGKPICPLFDFGVNQFSISGFLNFYPLTLDKLISHSPLMSFEISK